MDEITEMDPKELEEDETKPTRMQIIFNIRFFA